MARQRQTNTSELASRLETLFAALGRGDYQARAEADGLAEDEQRLLATIHQGLDRMTKEMDVYRASLDAIPFPVSVTDEQMNWLFFNQAAVQVTGLDREEMKGKQCCNWGADICNTERCGIAKLRAGETTSYFTQPGLDMDFQVDVQYIADSKGERLGHIEVVQDITTSTRTRQYQAKAVEQLTGCLAQFARGDLEIDTSVAEADAYTEEVRQRFLEIKSSLDRSIQAVRAVVDDTKRLADAGSSRGSTPPSIT